jgi:hypothetical protein
MTYLATPVFHSKSRSITNFDNISRTKSQVVLLGFDKSHNSLVQNVENKIQRLWISLVEVSRSFQVEQTLNIVD